MNTQSKNGNPSSQQGHGYNDDNHNTATHSQASALESFEAGRRTGKLLSKVVVAGLCLLGVDVFGAGDS